MIAWNFAMYLLNKISSGEFGQLQLHIRMFQGVGGHVLYSPQALVPYGAHSGTPSPQMKNPAYTPDLEEGAPTD